MDGRFINADVHLMNANVRFGSPNVCVTDMAAMQVRLVAVDVMELTMRGIGVVGARKKHGMMWRNGCWYSGLNRFNAEVRISKAIY